MESKSRSWLSYAFFTLWHKYCCFHGRATRAEYWSFFLFHYLTTKGFKLLAAPACVILFNKHDMFSGQVHLWDEFTGGAYLKTASQVNGFIWTMLQQQWNNMTSTTAGLTVLVILACSLALDAFFLLPAWGAAVRRLHDVGWSGWWAGLGLFSRVACYGFAAWTAHSVTVQTLADGMAAQTPLHYLFYGVGQVGAICVAVSGMISLGIGLLQLTLGCIAGKPTLNRYGPSPKLEF